MAYVSSSRLFKLLNFPAGLLIGCLLALVLLRVLDELDSCPPEQGRGLDAISTGPRPTRTWSQEVIDTDLNPVVKLIQRKEANQKQSQQEFLKSISSKRPRLMSTELGLKDKLFVGIVTTGQSVATMGSALNGSLKRFADKVTLFAEKSTSVSQLDRTVGDLRPFTVLEPSESQPLTSTLLKVIRYLELNDSALNGGLRSQKYDYFLVLTDQNYVNLDKLDQLLSSSLVSLNRSVLLSGSHLQRCDLSNLDVHGAIIFNYKLIELCSQNATCWTEQCQQSVTSGLDFDTLRLEYDDSDELQLNETAFSSSLVTFPVFTLRQYLKLDKLAAKVSVVEIVEDIRGIEREISQLDVFERQGNSDLDHSSWPPGVSEPFKVSSRFDVLKWTYIESGQVLFPNDFETMVNLTGEQKDDLVELNAIIINYCASNWPDCTHLDIKTVYTRFDASRGLEFLVDLKVNNVLKRVEIVKPLNSIELLNEVPFVTESSKVIISMPVRSPNDVTQAMAFLSNYARTCLKRSNHQTVLILLLFYPKSQNSTQDHDVYGSLKSTAMSLERRFRPNAKIIWISFHFANTSLVSELAYLDILSNRLPAKDTLLLHLLPNARISFEFLNRVRMNTIQGYQVFFPVPFVEYKLSPSNVDKSSDDLLTVSSTNGYFDASSSQQFAFYVADYLNVRQSVLKEWPERYHPIISKESELTVGTNQGMDMLGLFIDYSKVSRLSSNKYKTLNVLKAIDPDLKERYVETDDCSPKSSNEALHKSCLESTYQKIGLKSQLASLLSEDNKLLMNDDDPRYR